MDGKRTTQQIDAEIEQRRQKAKELQARLEEKQKHKAKLEARRKALRSKAVREEDPKARAELERLRHELSVATMEAEDIRDEISTITAEVEQLLEERAQTYREEKWEEARAAMKRAQSEAEEIHLHLEAFGALLGRHDATLSEIRLCGNEAGQSDAAMTRFKLTHVTRTLFNFYLKKTFPTGMGIEYSKQYERPYMEIMAQVVEGAEHKAQPNGHDTVGTEAETQPEAQAEAGAEA